jgi:hypothetical protein
MYSWFNGHSEQMQRGERVMRFADLKTGKKLMGGYFVVALSLGRQFFTR